MMRTILLMLLLVVAVSTTAQPPRTWEAAVEHPDPNVSPKPVFAAIVNGLPGADVNHFRKIGRISIVTELSIEIPWLESVLTEAGFTLVGLWLEGQDLFGDPEEEDGEGLFEQPAWSTPGQSTNTATNGGQ